MTISSETRKAGPFNGNGVTTSFPFVFKTFAKSDVKVIFTDADEIETILVLDSDYTVTLNADQNANPGGSISYSMLATGEKLTVLGAVEYTQETDVQNQGGFYPEVIENAFDKITMLIQQVKEIADRAVVVPASSSVTSENYLNTINTYKLAAAGSAAASALSAIEASGYADAAEADKIQTGLDRIQTGLDVLATAQDVLTIEGTVIATAADRVQTGIDASFASTSATNAAGSALSASTSATNAAGSALSASTSATNAASSASAAASSYDDFDDRYLGSKSSVPISDNDGNALLTGALYFSTVDNAMKVWNGSAWLDAYASLSGALIATNNLSDLQNPETARNNLGLPAATQAEMETGSETLLRAMSPLRIKQAIAANASTSFPAGTRMPFNQSAAPTGWTKDTTAALDDSIMRIVTGTVSSGGSTAFSTFNGQTSVGATTLTESQIPSHSHTVPLSSLGTTTYTAGKIISTGSSIWNTSNGSATMPTNATGGGGSHTHSITTNIKYNDFIIASKN